MRTGALTGPLPPFPVEKLQESARGNRSYAEGDSAATPGPSMDRTDRSGPACGWMSPTRPQARWTIPTRPTGPAFEGAQLSSGQRATIGAIERVRINRETLEPRVKVIGIDAWSDEPGFAEQSVKAHDPDGWAVLLDVNGNLAEGMGSNIFVVRGDTLYTPSQRYVLAGISRQMTLDLAHKLDISVIEGDIDLFDAENAEEMFLTSTSLCIAGVRTFNGARIGDGRPPGPITTRLTDAYIAEVGCDFVKQYLERLS